MHTFKFINYYLNVSHVIICSTLPPIVSTKQYLSFIYTDIGIDNIEWLKAYALEFSLGSDTYCTKNSASRYTSVKSNAGDQVLSEVEKNSFIALPGKESTAESCLEKQYVSQPRRIWAGKAAACNGGDVDSIPGLGRSTGEGKGYPLQYSGLENSMDCLVHGVTKSQRWLNDFHFIAICQRWVADQMRVCAGSQFSSVQSLSHVQLFVTSWIAARQASLSITNSWSLPKLMSIELAMPSSHLILCCSLFLLPPIPHSIRVFFNESTRRMRWPNYWSFSFSIKPSNERSGLISFRMDWLDLLAVQGTLKSLLQHHSSK